MFRTLILTAWTLIHLYVFWRASTVPAVAARISPRWVWLSGALSWSTFALFRGHGHDAGGIGPLLELVGLSWLTALFLTAVALLAVDLATGFGIFFPRIAPRLRGYALLAGGLLAATALVQGMRPPVVRNFEVRLPGLSRELDGTTLAALSDAHLGSLLDGEWLTARVAQVNALRPDVVLLLGDIVEGHGRPDQRLAATLGGMHAPLGVWAVNGNHEGHGDDPRQGLLEMAGVGVLRDRWVEARPGLVIAGTEHDRSGDGAGRIRKALAGRPPGAVILLSHSPREAEAAASAGVGLMLSGHTHGGQVWPFGWLVRLTTPFVAGRYRVGGMTLLVSRGAGTWGVRMRLWQPGEILRITLRA
jgi:predicted MPP superfamily phosphohydrolase